MGRVYDDSEEDQVLAISSCSFTAELFFVDSSPRCRHQYIKINTRAIRIGAPIDTERIIIRFHFSSAVESWSSSADGSNRDVCGCLDDSSFERIRGMSLPKRKFAFKRLAFEA